MKGTRRPGERGPVKPATRYGKGTMRANEQRAEAAAWFAYLRQRGNPMKAVENKRPVFNNLGPTPR